MVGCRVSGWVGDRVSALRVVNGDVIKRRCVVVSLDG